MSDYDDATDQEYAAPPGEWIAGRLRSAATITPRPVRWLWADRLALGKLTVLDGRPGLGKSSMTLDIAARVTRGLAMPDGSDPMLGAGNVLLVTAEDDWSDTVVPRLMAAGADLTRVYELDELDLPDGADALEARIREVDALFVGIDPLVAFVAGKYNLYRDQDARFVLKPLAAVLARTGAAGLGLRHVSKATGIPAQDRGTGSVAIGGAARSNLIVAPDPDMDERFVLASIKNNLGRKPPSLSYGLTARPIDTDEGTIWAPRLDWHGEVELDADDLMTPEKQGEAAKFLMAQLGPGPMAAKKLEAAAKEQGLSWSGAVRRASERMAVVKKPNAVGVAGSEWMWSLPDSTNTPVQHAQHAQDGSGDEHRIERIERGVGWSTPLFDEAAS